MFTTSMPNNNSSSRGSSRTSHLLIHNSNNIKKRMHYNSSIMDHSRISSEQKVEIQGYYWPRIILAPLEPTIHVTSSRIRTNHENNKATVHHKNKSTKEKQRISKSFLKSMATSKRKLSVVPPCDHLASDSLLELLHDVPSLLPEDQQQNKKQQQQSLYSLPRSPITGKLLSPSSSSITTTTRPTGFNLGRSRLIVGPTKKKMKKNNLDLPSMGP